MQVGGEPKLTSPEVGVMAVFYLLFDQFKSQ
jgi:hypothetical protein